MTQFGSVARAVAIALLLALLVPVWEARAVQPATPAGNGATVYVDPAGRFTLPLPTGWTSETRGDIGVITSPEGGITVYALALPGTDVPEALAEAWRIVDPAFDLAPGEPLEVPAMAGLRPFTLIEYQGAPADQVVQAVGQEADGTVYALLVRADREEAARRESQMQTAALGLQITGVEQISLLGVSPRTLTPALLAEVDVFVAESMERFGIPGVAYAVVQDGEIVHAAGFGVTEAGGSEVVTAETQMLVGSVTKPMTTMYMGSIVDDGAMRWDTPVVESLPSFAVADPEITPRLTMRDLVCACTGVPRRDLELVFESKGVTAAETIASLREFTFFTPVGEAFQYSNQMVAAGGYIAALASGGDLPTVHEDYVLGMEQRIFGPIGMDDTTFSEADVWARGNYALPHALALDGAVTSFPLDVEVGVEAVAPAGGAWSTVEDLGRFVVTQLQRGRAPDGTRVVSEENLTETWLPQVQVAPGFAYGLGWIVTDYQEQPLLYHTGGTLGYNAEVALLPEAGLGVAVVVNRGNVLAFAEAVRTRVLEVAFEQPPAGEAALEFAIEQQRQELADLAATLEPVDEIEVQSFLGTWNHPALGDATLSLEDGRLMLDAGEVASELAAVRGDGADGQMLVTVTPPLGGLRVSLRDEGGERTLVVHDPASTDLYVFGTVSPAAATPVARP
jgi:CubicO group peptidase (beta-lactamase class C family)